eukprot:scaffold201221_cov20-Tisochrysis_lutea.AAC.2
MPCAEIMQAQAPCGSFWGTLSHGLARVIIPMHPVLPTADQWQPSYTCDLCNQSRRRLAVHLQQDILRLQAGMDRSKQRTE